MRQRTLWLTAVLSIGLSATAQVFDMQKDRVQMAEFRGLWRFHTGDDPRWSDPAFDDSSWSLLRSDQPWSDQGYKGYSGFAWYRFGVTLPPKHPPLALYIPEIMTSYQVFAGGRLVGQMGGLPPQERVLERAWDRQVMLIPANVESPDGTLHVAIRVWHWPYWAFLPGGPRIAIRIGDANLLSEWRTLQLRDAFWSVSANNLLLIGYVLAGFTGLGLFLLRPGEHEYLWFTSTEFGNAAFCGWEAYRWFQPAWLQGYYGLQGVLYLAVGLSFPTFIVALLKERRGWAYWIGIASMLAAVSVYVLGELTWISMAKWVALGILFSIPYQACVLLLLISPAWRGNLDARLLLAPVGLNSAAFLFLNVLEVLRTAGRAGILRLEAGFFAILSWPFPISVKQITEFVMQISILAILVLRFARSRRDEERLSSELEAARTVQQVLIPEDIPAIPGYAIECAYKPAGQVGGDFFQILPLSSGGALIAIGDVSGKGMPAAMTVSLLVGTLRAAAESATSPAALLTVMNRHLIGRTSAGFTTCLILQIAPDGAVTAANAGHIAPYINGHELPVENGLPLGLAATAAYSETRFQLAPEDRLTLLTDGVVEARKPDGELFGFERAAFMSVQPAVDIAYAAQQFGQEDDITVLSLTRQASGEQPIAIVEPTRSPASA